MDYHELQGSHYYVEQGREVIVFNGVDFHVIYVVDSADAVDNGN